MRLYPSRSTFSQNHGIALKQSPPGALEYWRFHESKTKLDFGRLSRGCFFFAGGAAGAGAGAAFAASFGAAAFFGAALHTTAFFTKVTGPTTFKNSGWFTQVVNHLVTHGKALRALSSRTSFIGRTRAHAIAISARVIARPTKNVSNFKCSSSIMIAALRSLPDLVVSSGQFSIHPMIGYVKQVAGISISLAQKSIHELI
mmetsp:Transcript_9728/g.15951  ORF Transcript_9728/g.15951 Transcript_9728/m.15951 type:complete len:200 (+) Transcript_9728:4295-4894(+)